MNYCLMKWGILTSCIALAGCNSESSQEEPSRDANVNSNISTSSAQTSSQSNSSLSENAGNEATNSHQLVINAHHPSAGAINMALVSTITVAFNKEIMAQSFNDELITLSSTQGTVSGTLEHDGKRFTFTPSTPLSPNTQFTVRVDQEVMSQDGLTGSELSWQFTTTANVGATPQAVIDTCMDERDIAMLDSVNNARSQSRVCGNDAKPATTPLRWNCLVEQAAQIHSDDMANNNFFDHSGSDGSDTGDRLTRVGYNYRGWGENIAAGQRNVTSVMQGWLDSPGHCRNLMSASHQEFGLGYTLNNNTTYNHYWTQKFASPQ
ncbi:CAP domain-containing protein [Marinagarivorans algicola]|uniref:CAP domain-containing protein n=2 Tax=Marinagarivorans algicola TaxID=1513270 RepID=UPI0009EB9AA0|nr:CAP domain-containing protein [Marinagarivorans algicola]